MANTLSEQCPTCGATLKFHAKQDKFICDYCENEYTLEKLEEYKKKYRMFKDVSKMSDMDGYRCSQCGAEIITGDNTASTSCVYCKNTTLIYDRLTDLYAPSRIITFKYDKNDAIEAFKKKCKGRPLLPKNFNDTRNIQDMEGLYVPFWLFDLKNDCNINASCTRTTHWSDSSYYYTKTDYYNVVCDGKLVYDLVPADGSSRFDDKIMNAIEPFDYKDFKDFNMSYLSGYISEKYDVDKDKSKEVAFKRVEEDSKKYLLGKITGYTTKSIKTSSNNINLSKIDYVLLPVYVLNIKYKDKIYHFAYNGQTGKMVGEIPVDKKKLFIILLLVYGITLAIIIIYYNVSGYRW